MLVGSAGLGCPRVEDWRAIRYAAVGAQGVLLYHGPSLSVLLLKARTEVGAQGSMTFKEAYDRTGRILNVSGTVLPSPPAPRSS